MAFSNGGLAWVAFAVGNVLRAATCYLVLFDSTTGPAWIAWLG